MKCFFCFGLSVSSLLAHFSVSPEVDSAILINAENGKVLFEKKAHEKKFPASVTKIATALFVLDHFKVDLDTKYVIDPCVLKTASMNEKKKFPETYPAYVLEPDGTTINLLPFEKISVRTLLYGLMLGSGNDAANALAYFCTKDTALFCKQMNEYLRALGCRNTYFMNPHGLHHDLHVTTASDLAIMAKKAMKSSLFSEIVKTVQYTREETNKQKSYSIIQTNRLMKPGPYFYSKATGIKTGYTSNAGFNLVASATNGHRNLIAVLLGSKVSDVRFKDAVSLFEEAFKEGLTTQRIYAAKADVFKKTIPGADQVLRAFLKEDVEVKYYPSEPIAVDSRVRWFDKSLPISVDSCVGVIEIVDKETQALLLRKELYSANDIDYTSYAKFTHKLGSTVHMFIEHKYAFILGLSVLVSAVWIDRRSRRKRFE